MGNLYQYGYIHTYKHTCSEVVMLFRLPASTKVIKSDRVATLDTSLEILKYSDLPKTRLHYPGPKRDISIYLPTLSTRLSFRLISYLSST